MSRELIRPTTSGPLVPALIADEFGPEFAQVT